MENQDVKIAQFYIKKVQQCKDRGIVFDLSFMQVKNMLKAKRCQYTGLPLTPGTFSIDRIDSSKGYVTGNVLACHKTFNAFKGTIENKTNSLTFDDVLKGLNKLNKLLEK